MKIRRYPQSCFMVSNSKVKILVDPGKIDYSEGIDFNTKF